jgi:DNA-binding transcriptional MerR regulator
MQPAYAKRLKAPKAFPDKLFYKIGEVSKITGVEPYVLRYWETEFPFLKPRKSRSGQRIYSKKDLEIIFTVRDLLYKERYTIEGVRKKLGESGPNKKPQPGGKVLSASSALEHTKKRLRELINRL